ncbi:uncharacterized membrane protein YcaP (DUF421 family) [Gracilibacillus halotolerans]|uniref:Uncharacterized membrane protein YcaP (DUF421 family) n=1 Tax=Gracilibacillus halotolerans TaxID=74386 RepID=A0A841RQV1_9BACI|nr:DUF421 domain-containing protein [Gracilibacillus halotolerans]MBB6514207.1 uncharacterized membrane protein YcaP (DUF421 family) [Gracilibacillus halotolerans]
MDWDLLWKAVIIVIGGTFLLRLAGRKSISQMTLAQTVIMIGIGSLLIQPIAGESIWATLGVGLVLVLTLIVMEYAQVKANSFENILTGKSKILIENGILQEKNLKKFRLTVDQLEMNLRQQSVSRIEDVKWATLEPNGRVAVVLKDDAQPVTKKEFQQLTSMMEQLLLQRNQPVNVGQSSPLNLPPISPDQPEPLFDEVHSNSHKNKPPEHLQ